MFKDGGKGGKAEVGFPCFPRAGISTAQFSMCFGSFLLPLESSPEAIRFRSGLFLLVRRSPGTGTRRRLPPVVRNRPRQWQSGRSGSSAPSLADLKIVRSGFFARENTLIYLVHQLLTASHTMRSKRLLCATRWRQCMDEGDQTNFRISSVV